MQHHTHPTLTDTIYHYLKNEILNLNLEPGDRLSEAGIARQFECSRIPVREAVQRLVAEGALEVKPQRGSFVTPIDLEQMERVRYIREVLETRVIVDDFDKGLLTPLIPILRSMVHRQAELMNIGNYLQAYLSDNEFHLLFYSIDHKDFVSEYAGMRDINYYRGRLITLRHDGEDNFVSQHEEIIEAIEKRDRTALKEVLHRHYHNVGSVIRSREILTARGLPYFK